MADLAAGLDERVSSTLLIDADWQLAGGTSAGSQMEGVVRARRERRPRAAGPARLIDLGLTASSLDGRFAGGRSSANAEIVASVARVELQGEVEPALAFRAKSSSPRCAPWRARCSSKRASTAG